MRARQGVVARFLRVGESPVLVRAWEPSAGRVALRAEPVDPDAVSAPRATPPLPSSLAGPAQLRLALERMRFALGVDDDLSEFYRRFRRDPLLGPSLRRRPWLRPRRRPWAWEALAWAVVKQLIESERAARIQRRIVGRWGARLGHDRAALRDVPSAATIAGRAPAELVAMDLSPGRSLALRAVAREIASGRCDPADPAADRRLLAVPDRAVLGVVRARRPRFASSRRSDLPEAGRPHRPSRPPRQRRGGRGVLRAVPALSRSRRPLDDRLV